MAARTKREFLLKVMGMFKIVENGTRLSNCRKRRSAWVLHCNRRGRWVVGDPVIPTKHRNLIVGFSRQIRTNDVIVFKGNQVGTVRNFSSCRRENNPPFQASPLTGNVKTSYVDPQTRLKGLSPILIQLCREIRKTVSPRNNLIQIELRNAQEIIFFIVRLFKIEVEKCLVFFQSTSQTKT